MVVSRLLAASLLLGALPACRELGPLYLDGAVDASVDTPTGDGVLFDGTAVDGGADDGGVATDAASDGGVCMAGVGSLPMTPEDTWTEDQWLLVEQYRSAEVQSCRNVIDGEYTLGYGARVWLAPPLPCGGPVPAIGREIARDDAGLPLATTAAGLYTVTLTGSVLTLQIYERGGCVDRHFTLTWDGVITGNAVDLTLTDAALGCADCVRGVEETLSFDLSEFREDVASAGFNPDLLVVRVNGLEAL